MKKLLFPILLLSVFFFSCKKKQVEVLPESNSAVYLMDGEFDGQTISHIAGDNGMVMNSGTEVRNGVKYAYSEFTDGETKFKFGLYDGNIAIPAALKTLEVGDILEFAEKSNQPLAFLSPSLMTNEISVDDVDWYVDGVLMDNGAENINLTEPGVYYVRGKFMLGGLLKNVTNRMYLGFENDVDFSVHHLVTDPNDVKLWIEGETQNIDSIRWYIDGQYVWTGETCQKDIGVSTKDVTAKVYYNNGAVQQKRIVVDGSHQGLYIEDFNIFLSSVEDLIWDYKVGLEVERDGESYSSFEVPDNDGSWVVKSLSLYKHPITGADMIRVEADITTKLKSESSGQIIETSLHTFLGFPVPQ